MLLRDKTNNYGTPYIRRAKSLRFIGATSLGCLVLLSFLTIFPIVNHIDSAEATPGQEEVPTLAMVVGRENANLDITPTDKAGTFASSPVANTASFNVATNNYTGYTVSIKANDDLGKLTNSNTSETLDSITSATDATTFATGSSSTYTNKWGYQPNKLNSVANTNFLPAPTTTPTVLDVTTTANTTANNYTIGLGARIDYTKSLGTYTNTYTITAVANYVAYHIYYYNGISSTKIGEQQSATNTAATIKIAPTFDSGSAPTRATYTFKSWCKGTVNSTTTYDSTNKVYVNSATVCTGTEYATGANLPIDPTQDNTNIKLYAVWKPTTFDQAYAAAGKSKDTASGYQYYKMQDMDRTNICQKVSVNQVGTLVDSRVNGSNASRTLYKVAKLDDGECWMLENLSLDIATLSVINSITTSNTHVDSTSLSRFKNGSTASTATTDRYAVKGVLTNSTTVNSEVTTLGRSFSQPVIGKSGTCSTSTDTSYPCKYNGTYNYNTVLSTKVANSNFGLGSGKIGIHYNVCAATAGNYCYGNGQNAGSPPANGTATADICPKNWRLPTGGSGGEYQTLCTAIRGSACAGTVNMTPTDPNSMQFKLSLLYSGFHDSIAAAGSQDAFQQGSTGTFWSSNAGSGTDDYQNMVYAASISSSGYVGPALSLNFRGNAKSIRCIAKT